MIPKLFVSYSWTTPEHEAWTLDLATQLRDAGVDVILDKWDLKEGHDANAFMEKMVTDVAVTKVIMICDRAYAQKADARRGGVGTEAQIISAEVYKSTDQGKFVAIVKERDPDGHPYLPAYYSSRIYIDLSDSTAFSSNFEQLLRWIYDQPIYRKPPLGSKPAYLSDTPDRGHLSTSLRHKRATDAIKNGRDYAEGAIEEYLSTFATDLESFRVTGATGEFDDAVLASIEAFTPYRNEFIALIVTLAQYRDTPTTRRVVHRFFETLIPYLQRPNDAKDWTEWGADNFRFIIHELFLYTFASYVRHERFSAASHLIRTPFYVSDHLGRGSAGMVSFEVFREHLGSFDHRNRRLNKRLLSMRADILKERCNNPSVSLSHLMQADFLLYLHTQLGSKGYWWPEMLLYAGRYATAFEVFVRAQSQAYFENLKLLLDINDKDDLGRALARLEAHPSSVPTWEHVSIRPRALMGYEQLATLP